MIYLDTSALVKLVIDEEESVALIDWLGINADALKVTSQLAHVELIRACNRLDDTLTPFARSLLSGIGSIPITSNVLNIASDLKPYELRSLDSIHLASAISIGSSLSYFVAYDLRLCAAAGEAGFSVESPSRVD
ncbi:type II toxin-antitoxin system VapC family toxin [Acidithrix ferrooxidans]|uniref:Ribonuclease VapC47 n=1 Tax=Acidithrix ferrooxidans TaxID=1280514 RepID=A0A0D8HFY8_9ACTN|nr:type II toxin-antitoxin system VapC family toxin [Acidithrix ferrooxidans]KJF16809.1 ribonuclease VapC47 [Acidithrix ferrooxidans]